MNARMTCIAAAGAALALGACGGGTVPANHSRILAASASAPRAIYNPAAHATPRAQDVALTPIVEQSGILTVGMNILNAALLHTALLAPLPDRPGTSWGRVQDGVGKAEVQHYLDQILFDTNWPFDNNRSSYPGLVRFLSAPTVRIAAGATTAQVNAVRRGVQIVNEALPPRSHIRIGPDAPAFTDPSHEIPRGQIHVFFAPRTTWPHYSDYYKNAAGTGGMRWSWNEAQDHAQSGRIWMHTSDTYKGDSVNTFVHELLHALGFMAHPRDVESILNNQWNASPNAPIWPLDGEALRAAYMHLNFGDDADAIRAGLADWSSTSTYLVSKPGITAFGAAHRNGFVRPWAGGPSPRTDLADSALSGDVEWHGALLGFTPGGAAVAGDAAIGVDLATLLGTASFENLETWTAGNPPGAPGTGATWGDGDLGYGIIVNGNIFRRTGGDHGVLTGIFVGLRHEGTAGTLERDDLSAGFGATRGTGRAVYPSDPVGPRNRPGYNIYVPPPLPTLRPTDVALAPVLQHSRQLRVGADVPEAAFLAPNADRPGTSWGRLRDGVGRTEVAHYLESRLWNTKWYAENNWRTQHNTGTEPKTYPGLFRFFSAPTVHIEAGTSASHVDAVLRAVQIVNAILPPDLHLEIGSHAPAFTNTTPEVPGGQIHTFFVPRDRWPAYLEYPDHYKDYLELTQGGYRWRDDAGQDVYRSIWIHPDRPSDDAIVDTIVRELLTSLGFWRPATIPKAVHEQAVRAAYMYLDFGDNAATIYAKLGDWSDTSTHLAGQTPDAAFGAAHRNGFVRPWAGGPSPRANLADSPLRGNVAWNGELLGFTPAGAPVAGDAAIGVDLATLAGTAAFERLETWAAGSPPGLAGTGDVWGDGALNYDIAVRGNTFHRAGGDDGVLTGIFVGAGHEGAAGTLERDDLSAGFGATRE